MVTPGLIEGEAFVPTAHATGGTVRAQDMDPFEREGLEWSGAAQLWWTGGSPGARLTLTLPAAALDKGADSYELLGWFTRAPDYGDVRVLVNGVPSGAVFRGYAPAVERVGPVSFGRVRLHAGTNTIVLELAGKDARSQGKLGGYLVGVDGFRLQR